MSHFGTILVPNLKKNKIRNFVTGTKIVPQKWAILAFYVYQKLRRN